jgi:LysM repeat protein
LTFTVFPVTLTDTLTPTEVPCEPIDDWVIYIVRFGDTLYDLSVEYGVSMRTLQVANCLTSLELDAGQELFVPPTGPVSGNPDYVPPEGCDNPFIQITSPVIGEVITDGHEVVGLADTPDFGFYHLEVKHADGAPTYHTIHESTARVSSERGLGFIRFRENYVSDPYWLRVSVYDSQADLVGRCAIQVYFDVE